MFAPSPLADLSPDASLADVLAQVSEILRHSTSRDIDAQKRAHLRKHHGQVRTRCFLDDDQAKVRKYSIETGYDIRTLTYRDVPLEPWTGPRGSQRLYHAVMFGSPTQVGDYDGQRLAALEWMRDEGLAGVDDAGAVRPLSDATPGERRAYPGAPVSDARAKIGRYLRKHGRALVLAAMSNLMRRMPVKRSLRRKLALAGRRGAISLSGRDVATEANAIKAKRADLAEYRYLSVATVRVILKDLLADGTLTEAEPPRAIRANRSWRTLPRVFAIPADTANPPDERRQVT